MKALLYKEFKLAVHPICYLFIILFPLIMLAPNYPMGMSFLYLLVSYPILFLGANKGQQSNDLYYTTLLPVRKKDIVKARIFTVTILTAIFTAISLALLPVAMNSYKSYAAAGGEIIPGFTINEFGTVIGLSLIGLGVADLIFFPLYYRNGKSIVISTLLSVFFFAIYISLATIALPLLVPDFKELTSSTIWNQLITVLVGIIVYAVLHFVNYRVSSKLLEKVDF